MSRFVAIDRDTAYLLSPSVSEWLPQDHLARFVVEVVDQMDLAELARQYAGRGSAAYPRSMLLGLLMYGYASGVHSSRKIERVCHDSVAFRFIAATTHPDHDSIANFRRRFLSQIEALFVQVLMLMLAREMKCLKLPTLHCSSGRTDGQRPIEQTSRRPFQVRAVRLGHVLGLRGMAAR